MVNTITTDLSPAPSRAAPTTFSSRMDTWLGKISAWTTEANALATEANTNASNASSDAADAAASATAAVAASNATIYSAVATYSAGEQIIFTDGFSYTCVTATSAGESPTTHPAKWQQITTGAELYEEKTTSFTAEYGKNYILMNTAALIVTLPATVAQGQPIRLEGGLSAITNNVTVARNGNTIGGLSEDMTIDAEFYHVKLLPVPSVSDWRVGGSIS